MRSEVKPVDHYNTKIIILRFCYRY